MKFKIEIVETLSKVLEVDAQSESEAIEIVKKVYQSESVVLEGGDIVDTEFISLE